MHLLISHVPGNILPESLCEGDILKICAQWTESLIIIVVYNLSLYIEITCGSFYTLHMPCAKELYFYWSQWALGNRLYKSLPDISYMQPCWKLLQLSVDYMFSFIWDDHYTWRFPGGSAGKESACNERDLGSIPGLGRSPGDGKGYPLQYSGLENPMDCIVHGVVKSRTRLSDFHFQFIPGKFSTHLNLVVNRMCVVIIIIKICTQI